VLVGGAGAGREALGLIRMGYEVVAFDPCEPLVEAARALPELEGTTFLVGAYADLVQAARGTGPLARAVRTRFDAVILGWGSLSQVLEEHSRIELLTALRRLAPTAPVLSSFLLGAPEPAVGRVAGLRDHLRGAMRAVGAPAAARPGLRFLPWAGFIHLFAEGELERLASTAGYTVARFSPTPYPHALLLPEATFPA